STSRSRTPRTRIPIGVGSRSNSPATMRSWPACCGGASTSKPTAPWPGSCPAPPGAVAGGAIRYWPSRASFPTTPSPGRPRAGAGGRRPRGGGPAEPLVRALQHRDPETQFLAAEGLARGGKDQGLGILLTAVDVQPDFALRQRAVHALGELGDARALDRLLKI